MSQKKAKRERRSLRKSISKFKCELAADLKTAINSMRLIPRIQLAVKIIFKKEW